MIQEAHIDGLSHREIVIASLIATFKTKNRTGQQVLAYKDLLHESDAELIVKLGAILKLAIAMDTSEIQPIQELSIQCSEKSMNLKLLCVHSPHLELQELSAYTKEFEKIWGLKLKTHAGVSSMK
ncbi:hypothetical protein D3C85_1051870 [compost metagenome]